MNSTVLCKIRLSVHCNIMNYKIQNIKKESNTSQLWAWRSQSYSQCESNDTKINYYTLLLLLLLLFEIVSHLSTSIHIIVISNSNYTKSIKYDYWMFKVEIQPGVISNHPTYMGQVNSTDTEIIALEELHNLLFTMQKLLYWTAPALPSNINYYT